MPSRLRLDGRELLVVGDYALGRRRAIPDLLFGEHAGDQEHAKGGPDRELRTDRECEARHVGFTCNQLAGLRGRVNSP
jgi:hypothetical protein